MFPFAYYALKDGICGFIEKLRAFSYLSEIIRQLQRVVSSLLYRETNGKLT